MVEVPTHLLNDGVAIPQIGFGVFQISPEETVRAVGTALEAGYRLIDTASVYGNERGVGKALAQAGVPRSEIFVVTKVWNDDQGYDSTLRAFDESLGRLGLDYVDLYLIHWPRPRLDRYVDTWRAMEKLRSQGRIRSIGVSNFEPEQIDRLLAECEVPPSVNQVELRPGLAQAPLRQYHGEHGIVTQAWSPIGRGQGLLTHPDVVAVARAHDRTPAQVVLRWHVQLGVVPLPRSAQAGRIRSNLEVFDFSLTEVELARLTNIATPALEPDPRQLMDLS